MENYGSFKNLAGDKKGMTAEEAYIMLKNLGLLGQEFVPGATSIRKLMEGDVKGAGSELNDWIPGGKAVENLAEGKDQDWAKNALDLAIVGKPLVKGAKKAAAAIERMPKGGKEGFISLNKSIENLTSDDIAESAGLNEVQKADFNRYINALNDMIDYHKPANIRAIAKEKANKIFNSLDPQTKEAAGSLNTWQSLKMQTQMGQYAPAKPAGFDFWAPNARLDYMAKKYPEMTIDQIESIAKRENMRSGLKPDQGPIFKDILSAMDVLKAKNDQKIAKGAMDAEKAERKAAEQAAKEAKWKAEREAALKVAEEKRLAKEAEERRIAEEAEKQRLAEEAEAKRIADEEARKRAEEEEFERQFREEEGAERNRYADSLASVASREAVDNDINEWLYNKMLDEEQVNPVASMDKFTGESFGGTPTVSGPTAPATGKVRPNYDHSRDFNGGTFQRLDPIDRGTLKGNGDMGERIFDAQSKFYTPTVRPGENIRTTSTGRVFNKAFPKSNVMDPYHEAGIINDMNVKLNRLIDRERKLGFTDEEIYRKFKPEFDEYQGKIERYKTRLNNPESDFYYDGAQTNNIVATPSEEINVLRSLGLQNEVDPRMGNIMDDTRDHYQNLMKRIYKYESQFPQTPKLSTEQFKRLKDMGIRPEDIDMYLAEHPEFF